MTPTVRKWGERAAKAAASILAAAYNGLEEKHKEVKDELRAWSLDRLKTALRLDSESPIAREERSIIARQNNLSQVSLYLGVPRHSPGAPRPSLIVESDFGGDVRKLEQLSATQFRAVVEFPHSLNEGDTWDFGITVKIPQGQAMYPRYVFRRTQPVKEFDLRVRFPADNLPSSVWRIDRQFIGVVYDNEFDKTSTVVVPDNLGEVHEFFPDILLGMCYGLQWEGSM